MAANLRKDSTFLRSVTSQQNTTWHVGGSRHGRHDGACVVVTCVSRAEGDTDEGRDIKHVGWIAGFVRQVNQATQARKESVPAFARDDDTRA